MTVISPTTDVTHFHAQRLTGDWQVHPVSLNAKHPFPKADNPLIVPDSTHLQLVLYPERPYWGEHLRKINEQAWIYERTFSLPDMPYQRARLRFEGVDYFASVWVNGQFAGEHEGNFAPFDLDVTAFVHAEAENTLVVKVTSPWDKPNPGGTYPADHVIRGLIKGHYEHGEGVIPPEVNPIGIWRPVSLLIDAGISIDRLRIRTELDGQVDVRLTCTNATNETWEGTLGLQITADNHSGSGANSEQLIKIPSGTHEFDYTLQISDPQLWWPWDHGDANLYRLNATLHRGDNELISQQAQIFGLRTVRLERSPERFTYYINERPVFIRGTSYMPALYMSQCSRAGFERDIQFAREANLNLLRVHVHVSPQELYELCDRAGMLVWQDFELNWIQDYSTEFEARARVLQRDMINLLGNHPSIITWTCHNEPTMIFARRQNLEQHPDPALYADAVEQDPTRPVFICSGQMENDWQRSGDVHSYYGAIWTRHYTDIYPHSFNLNSEFGFEVPGAVTTLQQYPDAWERLKHLEGQIDALWAYQAELIQYQVEHLRRLRATASAGYIHFWLADLVPQVGCGVLDAQRNLKGGYAALKRASQPLHVAMEHDGQKFIALWVFNDTPKAYSEIIVRWYIYSEQDEMLLDGKLWHYTIAANTVQRIETNWPTKPEKCARIKLSISTAEDEVLSENEYRHPFQPMERPKGYPWKFDRYLGTKVFDRPDAPSLGDYNINRVFKIVPLNWREHIAEWALRQHFPIWFTSGVAKIIDVVTGTASQS